MKASWVYEVWKKNLSENILAENSQFNEHKLPVFYKLRVTTTGLGRREKMEVEELVNKGEGQYSGEFSSGNIDVVIAKRQSIETPKLKAAINQRKDCLCVEWIHDSFKAGCALPIETYRIDLQVKKITSTPEKTPVNSSFSNTQYSIDLSYIPNAETINDTAMSNLSIVSEIGLRRKRKSNDTAANENKDLSYKAAYEKLNLQEAKKAGVFLDSCSVRSIFILTYHICHIFFGNYTPLTRLSFIITDLYLRLHQRRERKDKENPQCWRCDNI